MFDWLKNLIISKYLGGIVRHIITAVAGFLLAIGIDASVVEQFSDSGSVVLVGVATWVIGYFASYKEKKKRG